MFKSFRVGSVIGIPLKLDITFLLILPVLAWIIGVQIDPLVAILDPLVPGSLSPEGLSGEYLHWILGLSAAVGLFASVALHELGHSVAAMRYGYHIDSITLWIFGGIAKLRETTSDWREEFIIAIAGPLVSVALGIIAYVPLYLLEGSQSLMFLFAYLALMNIALAGFNMLPAFPMDGGRVLRALLSRNRPFPRATKLASEIGKIFAVLMGVFGLFTFNIILIGIAVFVYIAAANEAERVLMEAALGGVTVEDVMTPIEDLRMVKPQVSVAELLDRMAHERRTSYPVVRNARPIGLVTLADAQRVRDVEQEALEVQDIMSNNPATVRPETEAIDAVTRLQAEAVRWLLVTDEGDHLIGLVSRDDLTHALNIIKSTGSWDPVKHEELRSPR